MFPVSIRTPVRGVVLKKQIAFNPLSCLLVDTTLCVMSGI